MPGAVFGAGLAALVLVTFAAARVAAEPLSHPLGCGAGPNEFRVTTFASGLNFPYGMQKLADGSLLVATSKPNAVNGSYFASTGELLRFADENKDGIADGPPTVLYSGLPGALTGLRRAGAVVFVTSAMSGSESITVLRTGPTPADPLTLIGSTTFLAWIYVSCSTTPTSGRAAGSCAFSIPTSLPAGSYELRLFSSDGFARLAISNAFTVAGP